MGIQCRIIRNKEGKVSYVEAPNGNRSQLYDDAVARVGEDAALDIVLTAYTPSFTEEVKNPKIAEYRRELVERINAIPSTVGNISIKLNGIDQVLNTNTLQMVTEDLGNGESLITFKADLETRNSMTGQHPVAPNGELSNLNQRQWEQVRTPEFMEWSNNWNDTILDENGEPKIHYHGSPEDRFYTFKSGVGLEFFSPSQGVAEVYMGFNDPNEGMYEVFLRSPKTLDVSKEVPTEVEAFMKKNTKAIDKYLKDNGMDDLSYNPNTKESRQLEQQEGKSWNKIAPFKRLMQSMTKNRYNWQILEYPPFVEFLKENGYTALRTLENTGNIGMFYPNTIKSATENTGEFSEASEDIRYSQGQPVYTANFVDSDALMSKYGQRHPNVHATHSTIEFRPKSTEGLPIGQVTDLKVTGRLTTDKVDVLLVENPLSKNKYPHITLSTAEGVMPKESNAEIEANLDKIESLNDNIESTVGTFDGGSNPRTPEVMLQGLSDRLKASGLAKEVNIVSESEIKKALEQSGNKFRQGINGFALGDVVYINKDRARLDTPIHEFGHLWNSWMQENAPEVFNKGIALIKKEGQEYIDIVKSTQPNLEGDALLEEALAQAIGDNGALLLGETQQKSFIDWLREAWDSIKGALGLAEMKVEAFQDLTLNEFATRAARDLMSGQALDSLMNSQAGTVGEAFTVRPDAPLTVSKAIDRFKYEADFTTELPRKTMEEVIEEYEGRVFMVTSDATGTGYDSNGDPILGGVGFMAIKENVDGKIGFASLDAATVTKTLPKITGRFGFNQKVAVMVMVQNADATVGNYYGAKYFGRGLRQLKEQDPSNYETIVQSIEDFIESRKGVRNEFKDKYKNGTLVKKGTHDAFIDLIRNVDNYSETEFATEFVKDTTFDARRTLLQGLLIDNSDTRTDKSTPLIKTALREIGFTQLEFLKEYGDNTIYSEEMYRANEGGFIAGGFEFTTPSDIASLKTLINETQKKGVTHPQFNGKVPTTGENFFLDGLYPINENFTDFAKLQNEINYDNITREQVDALARENFKKEVDYAPPFREGAKKAVPMSERGYTHLRVANKTKLKDMLAAQDANNLKDRTPNLIADVARGAGFYPATEAQRRDLVREAATGNFVRFSIDDITTQGQLTGLLMRGQWGMLTGENPNAQKLSDEENAQKNTEARAWLREKGYDTKSITGYYGNKENSFLVPNLTKQDAVDFAILFDQESVATNEGLVYQDGTMNPRDRREDMYGGEFEDLYSTVDLGGKPFNFAVGYDFNRKVDAGVEIKTKEQISSEVEDRGNIPHLNRDGEGNYVFYHWSSAERNEIDPSKSGSNPNSITSSGEASAISKVGGVAMFYTKEENKESGTGNYGHMVKVPMGKVYDMNADTDNLLPLARKRFESKFPNAAFDGNHQAAFLTQIANEKGYDMAIIKWGALYRAQTTKKMTPVEKEIIEGNTVKSTFTDYSSGKPKFSVGFMQTKSTPQGEQVKLSNVDDQIQGQGVGTEMYKQTASKMAQEGKSLVADNNNKGAAGIWGKLADAGVVEPVSTGDAVTDRVKMTPDSFDANGEPNVNDVIQFIQSKNYEGQTLSQEEINTVRNVMLGTTLETSEDLFRALKRAFQPNGVYNPSESSLVASGLYSRVEARRLLDSQDAQIRAYEMMHKIKNSDNIVNNAEVDTSYITITSSYTPLGTLKKANPFLNEKTAREILGGIKDETLFSNQAEANNLEFAQSKFTELSGLTKVPRVKVDGGIIRSHTNVDDLRTRLQETLTLPSDAKLVNNLNYILDIPNNIWNLEFQNVRTILTEIEKKAVDIGLDLSNLNETSYDKTPAEVKSLLSSVRNFAALQNESTFEVLVGEYVNFFDIAERNNTATLDINPEVANKTLRFVDTQLDSYTMFTAHGLLPLGNNVYQKVNANKSLNETIDIIYQNVVGGNNVLPASAFKNNYDVTNLENEEFVRQDIENYATEASKDIENSTSYDTDTLKKMVLFSAYFGTKLSNERGLPSVESQASLVENYPKNAEYLRTDFIADFNKTMLREKVRNSEKWNMFYKHFDISENGIELLNTDPITMTEIQPYLTPDLINHFKLKKEGMNLDAVSDVTNEFVNEAVLRNYYTNFPQALPLYKGTYQMDNGVLITNTNPAFLRVDEGAFEHVETVGAKSLYAPLNTNTSPYKIYSASLAAPILGEVSKFNTSQGVKADKKINNLYTKKQGEELTNEIDNC